MKKLIILCILSYTMTISVVGADQNEWMSPSHPKNPTTGWVCQGNCGDLPNAADSSPSYDPSGQYLDYSDTPDFYAIIEPNKPRIWQATCSEQSDKKYSIRNTTQEYWSTYLGGLVNHESLKEFFIITKNQYSSRCNKWFKEYVNMPFHKVLIYGYGTNFTDLTGYWAISLSTLSRSEAERFAIQACQESHTSKKIKSFNCEILFSNNNIASNNYIDLAKLNDDDYKITINEYKNEIQQSQLSQNSSIQSDELIETINKLKSLLDSGVITSGEFERMKQKVIESM